MGCSLNERGVRNMNTGCSPGETIYTMINNCNKYSTTTGKCEISLNVSHPLFPLLLLNEDYTPHFFSAYIHIFP